MHLSKLAIPTALVAILAFPVASNAALITPGSAARSNWGDMARTSFKLKTVRGKCTSSTVKSRFHSSVKRSYGRLAKGGTAAATDPCAAGTTPGTGGDLIVTPDPAGAGPLVVAEIFGQGGGSSNPNQGGQPRPACPRRTPPGHANGPAASGPGTPDNHPPGPPGNVPPVDIEDILPPGLGDPLELLLSGTGSPCVPGIIASCPPGTPQPPAGGGLPGNPFIPESQGDEGPITETGPDPDFRQDPLAFSAPAANVPEPASLGLAGTWPRGDRLPAAQAPRDCNPLKQRKTIALRSGSERSIDLERRANIFARL